MDVLDSIPILREFPPAVTVALVAMLPVIELRGAIPVGVLLGMDPIEAAIPAVIGNLIPVPFLVYLLDPVQRWLSGRSRLFDRFFRALFARTRRRTGEKYERFRDAALVAFVAVPLPGTGAWTGAAAAFVLDVKPKRALLLISAGVLVAAVVVTLFTGAGEALVHRRSG